MISEVIRFRYIFWVVNSMSAVNILCIQIHPLFPKGATLPFYHAGQGETSLMQALAPETVDIVRVNDGGHWYTEGAAAASSGLGEAGVQLALAHLREVLGIDPSPHQSSGKSTTPFLRIKQP